MAERLGTSHNTLTRELKRDLKFENDPSGEWLVSEEMVNVGGIEFGEWLPARTRVSKDGTRHEVGARKQDLEGLLELNRLINPSVKTVDTIISFWENHKKFSTKIEDDWVYIGTNIEPSPKGLETEYDAVRFAYDCALESALSGRTYEELAKDEKWYGSLLEQIENPGHGRSVLFGRNLESKSKKQKQQVEKSVCELEPQITAVNLKEFPLDTYRTSLHGVPGTLTHNGKTKELTSMWVIAHNGQETVDLIDSDAYFDEKKKVWIYGNTRLQLPIPEGVEIKTVADLAKLKKVQIFGEEWKLVQEMGVEINVKDNSFRIVSKDGNFELEVRTLACTDCQLPYWKFRPPTPQEAEEDFNPYGEFRMHSSSTGAGGYQCHVREEDGTQSLYCYDCVTKLEQKYLEDHPNARRSSAIKIAKEKLTEAGYPDVQIWDKQIWRTVNNAWKAFTYIAYERDGKIIRRHTGVPTISDDGHFEPNMCSREYVDFRYKAV